MDDLLIWRRQVLAAQPFSVLLGAELVGFSEDRVELNITITSEFKDQLCVAMRDGTGNDR